MNMRDELKALSDRSHDRYETLEKLYVQALKEGSHGMAAVIKGERDAAMSYCQALEDCRAIVRAYG